MSTRLLTPLLALVACAAFSTAGCDGGSIDLDSGTGGGDSGGEEPDLVGGCETTACGGDPTGDWSLSGVCFDNDKQPIDACADAYLQWTSILVSADLSLAADGTYSSSTYGGTVSADVSVPADCWGGRDPRCDDLEGEMEGSTCEEVDGGCLCVIDAEVPSRAETGTWTVADKVISFTPDDGDTDDVGFCADSDELWTVAPDPPDDEGDAPPSPLTSMIWDRE